MFDLNAMFDSHAEKAKSRVEQPKIKLREDVSRNIQKQMFDFDQLPKRIRDYINYFPKPLNPSIVLQDYLEHQRNSS